MGINKFTPMKKYITIIFIGISCAFAPRPCSAQASAYSQSTQILDTIYANDTKNVALFFPEPIRQGITGSDNYVFTYNREKEQYFGLLQAKPGKESNLLVINKNGLIFSYIVKYKKQLSKLNYFISATDSIGNVRPVTNTLEEATTRIALANASSLYFERFSNYLLAKKQRIGSIRKRSERISLRVENIVFDKEQLYFIIEIDNRSTLDYDVNFLKLFVDTRQKGKKKSLQRIYLEPVHKHKLPERVTAGKAKRLVYVMPKFSIADDRRVVLELNEHKGERNIKLKVSHRYINNPN